MLTWLSSRRLPDLNHRAFGIWLFSGTVSPGNVWKDAQQFLNGVIRFSLHQRVLVVALAVFAGSAVGRSPIADRCVSESRPPARRGDDRSTRAGPRRGRGD